MIFAKFREPQIKEIAANLVKYSLLRLSYQQIFIFNHIINKLIDKFKLISIC
jgi:hypothetical protein